MSHTHDSKHALTELGQSQVQMSASYLSQHLNGRTTMFASPYLRTMQTADAIRAQLPTDTPFYENLLLREWELGNLYDFQNRNPETKKEFKAAGQLYFRFLNGESLADVYLRAAMFAQTKLQRLETHGRCDNVIVVTHAAFIHMMLAFFLDWPVDHLHTFEPVENAAVIHVKEQNGLYVHKKLFVPHIE